MDELFEDDRLPWQRVIDLELQVLARAEIEDAERPKSPTTRERVAHARRLSSFIWDFRQSAGYSEAC